MKKFALISAGLCAAMFLAACDSTEKQNTSAGAVGDKAACCSTEKKCDAKCTGDAKTCTKADCCQKAATTSAPAAKGANMGAVSGEKKAGCCTATATGCPAAAAAAAK